MEIDQEPKPGATLLNYSGDTVTFVTILPAHWQGQAWLRTNIGHAGERRREIVRQVEHGEIRLGRDWYDLPMQPQGEGRFAITLGLWEVGHFEAKAFFLREGCRQPVWPAGSNTVINVEPARICCANIIYNAFVRQFGPNKKARQPVGAQKSIAALDEAGYTVIPPSGTFRDLIGELDFIIVELGCRLIQLLPIHPTPTTYARMGRFGSPYASLSFTGVDPALAQFDPAATPLEQFIELVDAVHNRGALILLDIAINHTGWAASLHGDHPQWLAREPNGQIEVPGAWGVTWADLTSLDYTHQELWQYMAEVFLTWCRRGVDGFRCDAGYMIPVAAWEYIIARVRRQFPDTIFLLEGLGGKISVTRTLLGRANFDWAYSELFQNYDRAQIEAYLAEADEISAADGVTIHFAETHDNNRLAAQSSAWARMRTALCALLSHQGSFAFANGVEWLAQEKIDVHDAPSLNWGAQENQVAHIKGLAHLLKTHPAFFHPVTCHGVAAGPGEFLAVLRRCSEASQSLVVLVNLDCEHPVEAVWDHGATAMDAATYMDLLDDTKPDIGVSGSLCRLMLAPGQVRCLGHESRSYAMHSDEGKTVEHRRPPYRILQQRLRSTAMAVVGFYRGSADLGDVDLQWAAERVAADPLEFCRACNPSNEEPKVVTWVYPRDLKREVMIPPDHFLLVKATHPFRAAILDAEHTMVQDDSLPGSESNWWLLLAPLAPSKKHRSRTLEVTLHLPDRSRHHQAPLLFLSRPGDARVKRSFSKAEIVESPLGFLGTNGRGGMTRAQARWGELSSRYDALLAANLATDQPEDRRIMLTRIRGWVVYQGYSQAIGVDCLDRFGMEYNSTGFWRCRVPVGQGEHVVFTLALETVHRKNAIHLVAYRHPAGKYRRRLSDREAVTLIWRPDIEDRNFHDTTKAYQGAEDRFPASVTVHAKGFDFYPYPPRRLQMTADRGDFVLEGEWRYMVHHPLEAQRGLDPDSDLYSPGYFSAQLLGGRYQTITAAVPDSGAAEKVGIEPRTTPSLIQRIKARDAASARPLVLAEAMAAAMDHYVVGRGTLATVIAGYPWFLDWGRDTLIFVRGMIAAGRYRTARAILEQFARFEAGGTIPNMIRGHETGNRDTSDAPLWLFVAIGDLVAAEGNASFLETDLSGRRILQILLSMARALMAGTSNGIRMDPASNLLYSPAHFTWMDTNHPAGTPRQGYPVEVNALWFAALDFLGRQEGCPEAGFMRKASAKVARSIRKYFYLEREGYLSDCLHCSSGVSAMDGVPDNALRPNQLLALTLGAITDPHLGRAILAACEELLVPGAIRSLAEKKIHPPLAVTHGGESLNDPDYPYQGTYEGDEDTRRKPAYHNGTAWTWIFPSYCEAWVQCYGDQARDTALAWLASATTRINRGCVGHPPEILDGNYPHTARGCDAQGWGASELYRVWEKIYPR